MKWVNYPFKMEKQYRKPDWDYSANGYYFITICTKDRISYFGDVVEDNMYISEIGSIVDKYWHDIPNHFNNIKIDKFVVMPNHIHGILIINNHVGTHHDAFLPTRIENKYINLANKSTQTIPLAMKLFKSSVKKYANQNNIKFNWQSRFHDRIIRTEDEYWAKRIYVENNIQNWDNDIEQLPSTIRMTIGRNAS